MACQEINASIRPNFGSVLIQCSAKKVVIRATPLDTEDKNHMPFPIKTFQSRLAANEEIYGFTIIDDIKIGIDDNGEKVIVAAVACDNNHSSILSKLNIVDFIIGSLYTDALFVQYFKDDKRNLVSMPIVRFDVMYGVYTHESDSEKIWICPLLYDEENQETALGWEPYMFRPVLPVEALAKYVKDWANVLHAEKVYNTKDSTYYTRLRDASDPAIRAGFVARLSHASEIWMQQKFMWPSAQVKKIEKAQKNMLMRQREIEEKKRQGELPF